MEWGAGGPARGAYHAQAKADAVERCAERLGQSVSPADLYRCENTLLYCFVACGEQRRGV